MNITMEHMCQAVGHLFGLSLMSFSRADFDKCFPDPSLLFSPAQFLSHDEMHALIRQLSPRAVYWVNDRASSMWLLTSIHDTLFFAGPFAGELLTRCETRAIYHHLVGHEKVEKAFFYEGEDQHERAFREYIMRLPIIGPDRRAALIRFLFDFFGEEPVAEEKIDFLLIHAQQDKKHDISKYISYYEDCEAALIACVAHASAVKSREAVMTLYQSSQQSNDTCYQSALIRFGSIAMLTRIGTRRAGVPAALSMSIYNDYMDKARQNANTEELCTLATELAAQMCLLVLSCSKHKYSENVINVIAYIRDHYHEKLTLSSLADLFGFNKTYLATCFKRETGMTVSNYVNAVRLEYARTLLSVSNLEINEICMSAGFADQSYFSRIFKEKYALSPSEYRHKLFNNSNSSRCDCTVTKETTQERLNKED